MCYYNNKNDFLVIYDKYAEYIYRICYSMLKNKVESEEAVQDVFTKLYTCEKDFETEEHVKAWLITVARNYCKNQVIHWWKTKRQDIDIHKFKVSLKKESNAKIALDEAFLKLPNKYKVPLILYYYDGYSIKEISNILAINENTIKTYLKRGKDKLKKLFQEVEDKNER